MKATNRLMLLTEPKVWILPSQKQQMKVDKRLAAKTLRQRRKTRMVPQTKQRAKRQMVNQQSRATKVKKRLLFPEGTL